jgi:hypothetical protein
MSDLEITKACAMAMGMCVVEARIDTYHGSRVRAFPVRTDHQAAPSAILYDPLHDDAQAMELVKKFILDANWSWGAKKWCAVSWGEQTDDRGTDMLAEAQSTDLNRAICECVAKLSTRTPA